MSLTELRKRLRFFEFKLFPRRPRECFTHPRLALGILLITFLFVYLWRLFAIQPLNVPDQAKIRLTGRVIQQPYLKGSNQIINVNGFLIKTNRFPTYFYGQKLVVTGKVRRRVINRFISRFSLYYPQIQLIQQPQSLVDKLNFKAKLLALKNYFEQKFEAVLPEPQASLLAGILLGSQRSLPDKFMRNLRETGTIHVVVASGYNLTVVAKLLLAGLLVVCRRRLALAGAFLGIVAYTIMTGGEPPVVRAAIMASLTLVAQLLGREKDALISLILAAALMLLVSPLILFDIGFQLSVLATAGILLVEPLLAGKIFSLPLIGEDLKVTLAAQIATLPILLFNFGTVSLLSPLVNALVLPVTPLIMFLGAITAVVGGMTAWLVWLPLTYFVRLIEWLSPLSQKTALTISQVSGGWVMAYYLVLAVWLWRQRRALA